MFFFPDTEVNNVKHCYTDPSYSVVAQHVEDVA